MKPVPRLFATAIVLAAISSIAFARQDGQRDPVTGIRLDSDPAYISMPVVHKALEKFRAIVAISAAASELHEHYRPLLDGSATVSVTRESGSNGSWNQLNLTVYFKYGPIYVSADPETGQILSYRDSSLGGFYEETDANSRKRQVASRDKRLSLNDEATAYLSFLWPREFKSRIRVTGGPDEVTINRIVGPYQTGTMARLNFGLNGELENFSTHYMDAIYDADALPKASREQADKRAVEIMRILPANSRLAQLHFIDLLYHIRIGRLSFPSPAVGQLMYVYRVIDPERQHALTGALWTDQIWISADTLDLEDWFTPRALIGGTPKAPISSPNLEGRPVTFPGPNSTPLTEITLRPADLTRSSTPVLVQMGDTYVWAKRVLGTPRILVEHDGKTRQFLLNQAQLEELQDLNKRKIDVFRT